MATLRQQIATNVLSVTKFRDLMKTVAANRPSDDLEIIRKAYDYSLKHHTGQTRASGQPYLVQPLEVAQVLAEMILAMVDDIRVVLIKLADRLHNMRTLEHLSPDRQQQIARETLDIYAPIAHRLGMGKVRGELEDLSFRYVDALAY